MRSLKSYIKGINYVQEFRDKRQEKQKKILNGLDKMAKDIIDRGTVVRSLERHTNEIIDNLQNEIREHLDAYIGQPNNPQTRTNMNNTILAILNSYLSRSAIRDFQIHPLSPESLSDYDSGRIMIDVRPDGSLNYVRLEFSINLDNNGRMIST